MIAAIFWGALSWLLLVLSLKALRARIWEGSFVAVCLAVLCAQACANAAITHVLVTAVEAAGR